MALRNLLAWGAMLVGVVGLAIDWVTIVPLVTSVATANAVPRSIPDAAIYFWTYFTHLTNLWLVLTYVSVLSDWKWLGWFRRPVIMASAAAFITLVMLYFHFMLSPYLTLTGALATASYLLHYVTPIAYLAWWGLFAPHGSLRLWPRASHAAAGHRLCRLGAATGSGGQ